MVGYSRKHTGSVPTSDTASVTVNSVFPSSEATSINAHTSSTVLSSDTTHSLSRTGTLDSDSDSESSIMSPIKGIRGNYKDLLAEYDEEDSEEDVDDLDRMVREMQREARGETTEEAAVRKPTKPILGAEKKQPIKRGVYGRPRSAITVPALVPTKKPPVHSALSVKTPVVAVPSPAIVLTSSLTSLSSLPPTSQSRTLVSGSSVTAPSSDTSGDKANGDDDEDETYPVRVASTTSHRRHVVQDSDDAETGDSSTPPAARPIKAKHRGRSFRSQVPTSSPSSPLRSPEPITSRARLVFSDEEDPTGPQGSTPVPVKTVFRKRRSIEKTSSDQKSSEDIDEFISSPVNPDKGKERQDGHHGLELENYGDGGEENEDESSLMMGPTRKGLTKKELEEMNKERARMNRERKTAITKPEARPQGMELFLSRMSKEKKERALKPQKPLNMTPQFKLPDRQISLDTTDGSSSLTNSHRAPTAEPKELMSEDSILPTSPPSESQPISSKPRALSEMLSITDSVADSDDDFQDVDKILAQDAAKRVAALATEEDRKRRLNEESQLQKAAEEEERVQRANFERLRQAKLKFLEKQKGGLNDVELVKKEGEIEQDGVEIEPVSTEDTAAALKTSNTIFTAKPADKDRYVSLLSRGQTPTPSGVGPPRDKRHTSLAPTESQVTYAGRTFGHGTTPAAIRTLSGQKVKHHHNVAVTQQMLNQKLLEEANQRAREERMAKEAKFGRGRTIVEKQELDIDGLKKKVESRIIKGVPKDMSEDEGDVDDAEDKDWSLGGGSNNDETPTQTDSEVDTEVEDEDEGDETLNPAPRPIKSRRVLVDEEDEISRRSLEPESDPGNHKTVKMESNKETSSSSHEANLDEAIDELGSLRPPPSSQLSRQVSDDEDEDEDDLPKAPRSRKRQNVLKFNDDEEDDDNEDSKKFPTPGSAQAKSLPPSIQATSSGPSLGYSNDGSFKDSDLVPTITETHDSDVAPEASFGVRGVEESFGGEGGFSQLFQNTQAPTEVSDESQNGGGSFGEGGFSQLFQNTQASEPSQAAQGFGQGGFSQLFTTTQVPTEISGESSKSMDGFDLGGENTGLDLGGEDSGFSQFYGDSQAPIAHDKPVVGALDQLRKNESVLVPQASYLPSVSVSNTQAERDVEIVALNNLPEEVREPTQAPQRYVNKEGFFTQHKPSTYMTDSPTLDTPFKSHTDPWETSSAKTPASPSRISSHLPALLTQPADLSSPLNTTVRRLVRRQDMPLTQAEEEDVEDVLISKIDQELLSSPIKRVPSKPKLDKQKSDRSKRNKELAKEFFEAEAVESDDEGDGFGFKFGAAGDGDEEEDDDPDEIVEGLVNDEEMTDKQRRLNDEARQELLRQQAKADEALRLQQAQDVAAGKLRKKHKDGADLGDDSEDEESFGTSAMRKELRRKRKLDRLDPLDALAAEPETEAFASLYQDTWKDDAAYDGLMSGGEDEASEDEHHYGDSLGIGKPRKDSSIKTLKRPGQRVVASPEPMQDEEKDELPIYLDEEDEFDSQGNVTNIRRQPVRPRPQPQPVQHEDEYSIESNPYSHSDPNNRRNSSSNSTKRQRLLDFAKDESQQSTAKGGSGSSVTSLKRKASAVSSNSSSSESVASRRKVGSLLGARSSLLGSIKGKWEK
ncbi:DNA replication checkpoint mediator, MRC1 domain [Phaffia rhodozyma]|uniref:DNA replication checkpoint mediator, MRC1 domain n=1 Tax=Phaffia rhodozyma TaxID=264483 RepID=A0A0F7SM66_PHARH|nr:DNA replication checkpoint mediator, MRC1 domain [Phaffia rhodozyma]